MELWNFRGKQNSITEALQIRLPEHAVISVTGSGGKTSLITAWARELAAAGKRTVMTTTTHMLDPSETAGTVDDPYCGIDRVITGSDAETGFSNTEYSILERSLDACRPVIVAQRDPDRPGKVMAPPDHVMEHLLANSDVVLIEADGSRRMPLKWPAPWEPAVPDRTDMTVCVAGLSALGRRLGEVMYRADELPERFCRRSAEDALETVRIADEKLLFAVLSSPEGGQKGARGDFRVFLNQADTDELKQTATRLQMMFAVTGIQSAWGSLRSM